MNTLSSSMFSAMIMPNLASTCARSYSPMTGTRLLRSGQAAVACRSVGTLLGILPGAPVLDVLADLGRPLLGDGATVQLALLLGLRVTLPGRHAGPDRPSPRSDSR